MPLIVKNVTRPVHDPMIPEQLGAAVVLLASLREAGLLRRLGGALKVSRHGGYTGKPLVAFALTFLVTSSRGGIRRFAETFKRPLRRVAAVAGCLRFPTQASMSRALRGLSAAQVADFTRSTLAEVPGLLELLRHPTVAHLDAHGKPWHVLDIDPTVEAHRRRDLVSGDDYPEGTRLAPGVPGYTGHKRGELRVRHIPILHAGAGVWLAYQHADENVHLSKFIEPLVAQARDTVIRSGAESGRIIIRGDGEFGSAGVIRAMVDQGVELVTRISRYNLLDRPEVAAGLATATWAMVRTSTRKEKQVAELGMVLLHPSEKSADADATPVRLRLLVVRKQRPEAQGHGVWRDNYQLEIFGTTLPVDSWPASDLVELYCGRSTIENCFAQEDRNLGLERMFCYHAPGQALMISAGLFLWNYMTCAGFLQNPPPLKRALAPLRDDVAVPTTGVVTEATRLLALERTKAAEQAALMAEQTRLQLEAALEKEELPQEQSIILPMNRTETANAASPTPRDPFPDMPTAHRETLARELQLAFANLLRRPGWSLDSAVAIIECPNRMRLFPFSVSKPDPSRPKPQIVIRTDVGACDGCPVRSGCFSSRRPNQYKQISRAVSLETAKSVRAAIKMYPPVRRMPLVKSHKKRRSTKDTLGPSRTTESLVTATVLTRPGPFLSLRPTFLSGAARRAYADQWLDIRVEVRISAAPPTALAHPLTAPPHGRARLRMTWQQGDAKWQSNANVRLILHIPAIRHRMSKNRRISLLGTT